MPVKPVIWTPLKIHVRGFDQYGEPIAYDFDLSPFEQEFFRSKAAQSILPYYQRDGETLKVYVDPEA